MIKTFIMLQNIYISYKCCSSELSIHQRNLKIFNNNNKCFYELQIRILELFLKDHVTGVMMLKIQLWNPFGINSILKYIQIENSYFK